MSAARPIEEIVEDAVIDLLRSEPFYAHVLLRMRRVFDDPEIPTAAMAVIDMQPVLYVNPGWFGALAGREQEAILKHEVLHFLHRHWARSKDKDAFLWQLACDAAINQFIRGLPPGGIYPSDIGCPEGLAAEEYYDLLQKSPGLTRTLRDGAKRLSGIGEGKASATGSHPWDRCDDLDEAMADGIVADIVKVVAGTIGIGDVPGECKRAIEGLLTPKNDWKHIARMFVARRLRAAREATWKRRSRRFGEMPGYKKRYLLNLLVAVDTSGSIGDDQLEEFWSVIRGIASGRDVMVTVVECDAKIHAVYPFKPDPPVMKGGGGTDFRPVFDWAAKQRTGFDAVVYLTDGFGPAPEQETIPTLWVISRGQVPASWGRAVRLDAQKNCNRR